MKNILTTGVIASFNQGKYIRDSVESLAAEVDELVVVDDGSTDGSVDLLLKPLPKNTTAVFNGRNLGVSATLNKAISHAQGNIILLQGGDDISVPGRADNQVAILKSEDVAISYSSPIIIGANGKRLPMNVAPEFLANGSLSQASSLLSLLSLGNTICAPSAAFRKSDFQKVGGFNPNLRYLQDFDLWLSLLKLGKAIKSDNPYVMYRKHSANQSKEGGQDFGAEKHRFAHELEFCLGRATQTMPLAVLGEILDSLKIPRSGFVEIDLLLLIMSLPLLPYKRIAIQKLLALQAIPELREELEKRGLADFGMKKLINLL